MSQIIIGKAGKRNVSIDLDVLIRTRLLIQANSGGGKSWLLRLIAEQLFGKIPIHIIDPEGEFASLREKFPFVLIGEGGEAAADVRSAGLVAQRLLELRASAVIDLYEAFRSKPGDCREWVRRYLEALIDAPKKLWRPLIVIADEAHKFCPQETPKAGTKEERETIIGCKDAMIALATVGRKRRFCAVWVTQRLAKVDKDASAELLNRIIGLTFEDVDIVRAADLLSIPREESREFKSQIRELEPGNWFAVGRAISKQRLLFKAGQVQTSHPDVDTADYDAGPPPTPDKIKHLLPKLSDLPQEAQQKAQSEAELKKRVRELEREVIAAKRSSPVAQKLQPAAAKPTADPRAIERAVRAARLEADKVNAVVHADSKAMRAYGARLAKALGELATTASKQFLGAPPALPKIPGGEIHHIGGSTNAAAVRGEKPPVRVPTNHPRPDVSLGEASDNGELSVPQKRILEAIAEYEGVGVQSVAPTMAAAWLGVKASTGSFGQNLRTLRRSGYIEGDEMLALTDKGREVAPAPAAPATTEALLDRAASVFGSASGRILRIAHAAHPEAISLEQIAEQIGVKASTGSFGQNVRDLVRGKLLDREGASVKAADWLFLE